MNADSIGRRGRWTALELSLVAELVPRRSLEEVASRLGRTPAAVRQVLPRVFDPAPRSGPIDEAELELLREGYGVYALSELAILCGRDPDELRHELDALQPSEPGRPWSRADRSFLRRAYGRRRDGDLALVLRRTEDEVLAEATAQGLGKDRRQDFAQGRPMPRWTQAEIAILRERYAQVSTREIAQELGRSTQSVQSKAKLLRLKKSPERREIAGRIAAEARHHEA